MKHRIRIKRRDGVRQRYWIGRKLVYADKSERKWDNRYPEVDTICPECGTKNWAGVSRAKGYKGIIAQCGDCGYVDKADKFIHSRTKQLESKNYGSKMFREQIKKELYGDNELREAHSTILMESLKKDPFLYDARVIKDPKVGSKHIIKVIEKNPDLLKNLKNTSIFFYESGRLAPSGFSHRQRNILAIDKKVLTDPPVWIDPISKSKREHPLKDIIKHEVTHLKQRQLSPDEQKELAANLAMRMDIRKEKPSRRTTDEDISKYFARE